MTIVVRIATPQDADVARRGGDEAFAAVRSVYRPNSAARMNLSALAPDLERLLAEIDGEVAGTVQFCDSDGCLRVVGLAVLPRFRRRGVARALIEELATRARDKGCRA